LRAGVKTNPGPGIEFKENLEPPRAAPGEVTLHVKSVGICGSDIHIYMGHDIGNLPKLPIPFIPGHEFSGSIESLGDGVRDFKVGDRVCAEIGVTCGQCYFCRAGQRVFCTSIREIGVDRDGAYAEYVSVPAYDLHKLPETMTYEEGSLVEPLSAALHPFERMNIGIRDTIAIVGAGPIGLLATGVARSLGYRRIMTLGRHEKRLELARDLGADYAIDIDREDSIEAVLKLTDDLGADVVLEATGNPAAFDQALRMTRKDGQVCLAGATLEPSTVSSSLIVGKSLRVTGSFDYTWITFERSIDLIASRRVDVGRIVTHKLALDEIQTAFKLVLNKESVKLLMVP
jgi:2-desacetyl-2-hydroxyethyl bacteriochlorophyllide A dehydrogenase